MIKYCAPISPNFIWIYILFYLFLMGSHFGLFGIKEREEKEVVEDNEEIEEDTLT